MDQLAPVAKKVPWWADVVICRPAQLMTVEQIARTASKYPFVDGTPKPDGTVDGLHRPDEADAGAAEDAPEQRPKPEQRPTPGRRVRVDPTTPARTVSARPRGHRHLA